MRLGFLVLVISMITLGVGCSDPRECECEPLVTAGPGTAEEYLAASLDDAIELQQQGHHEAALLLCDRVLERDPNYSNVHFVRGFSQQMTGQQVEAITSYGIYLRTTPDDAQVWFNLGFAQMETEAFAAAVESYQQALAHGISGRDVHHYLASCLEALGRTEEAADHRRRYQE